MLSFPRERLPKNPKFLIIKLRSIGDVIYNTAVYGPLKRSFPDCHLTVLVEHLSLDLVRHHPDIDQVLCFEKQSWLHQLGFYFRLFANRYDVAIDMPAGPSELLVVADDSADAAFVASDLLSQAEHGVDSQVILVSTSEQLIEEVEQEVENQLNMLPRKDIAAKAIENSKLIYVGSDSEALDLINEYGPEHFIICTKNEDFYVDNVINAGSVFIGNYTPESAGDYASGTNHTLPTNGYAKQYSGVNLDSFKKSITFQKISESGIQKIGPAIELMAEAEGLQAHKNAVTLRLNALKKN